MSDVDRIQLPPESTTNAPKTDAPVKPEWCPDKFWDGKAVNSEALAKSYGELEKSFSKPKQPEGEKPKPAEGEKPKEQAEQPKDKPEQQPKEGEKPKEQAKPAPLQPFFDEFSKAGKLAEESYQKLGELGIEREVVDAFIESQQVKQKSFTDSLFSVAGGEEGYQQMTAWAAESLNETEIEAYNKAVNSGNQAAAKLATEGLYARFSAESGPGKRVRQANGTGSGVTGFVSMQDVMKAMNDPRYKSGDPEYHAEVQQRLRISAL